MEPYPFTEEVINSAYIRIFSEELDTEELKWHWDDEDRIVEVVGTTDWKFQFDNELPIDMNGKKLFIKKRRWHRVIKGHNDLVVKIIKLK